MNRFPLSAATLVFAMIALAGCENLDVEPVNADEIIIDGEKVDTTKRETVFGEGGLFGNAAKPQGGSDGGALGVNAFLWRASLDTVSVWPITSADPFGGVIITDWYSPSSVPNERFKMNVFILGRQLRADGVRVSLFRQVRDGTAGWRDAETQQNSSVQLEDAILTRARQLRNQSVQR